MSNRQNERYMEEVYDSLVDYLNEAYVLNELDASHHQYLLEHPKDGLEWLNANKGINLLLEQDN